MTRPTIALACAAAVMLGVACDYGLTSPADSTGAATAATGATPGSNPAAAALTFTKDVQPILNSDCLPCHGNSRHDAGYNFATYAGVMRAVTPGSASSLLILVTRQGGLMYAEWTGSTAQRSAKAQTIYDWIVTAKAAQ